MTTRPVSARPTSAGGAAWTCSLVTAFACGACGGDLNAGWNEALAEVTMTPPNAPAAPSALPSAEPDAAAVSDEPDAGIMSDEPDASTVSDQPDAGIVSIDSGPNEVPGLLPVDQRNPILLCNDGFEDSWQGEFAILSSATTGPTIVGIAVGTSVNWPDLDANLAGWQDMVSAARASGLADVPDPVPSEGPPLVRPSDGTIDATAANRSAGAQLIIDASLGQTESDFPLVVVTGNRLTDVADAYLMDPTVAERVIVVSSLGSATADGADMGIPNGEMDAWADVIVAEQFRYIQVSDHYDQLQDVPEAFVAQLPSNPFGAWVSAKRSRVWAVAAAADQVTIAAMALPDFVAEVIPVARPGSVEGIPVLPNDPDGPLMMVSRVNGAVASTSFQALLSDPNTFAPR